MTIEHDPRFSTETLSLLWEAGWFPGRNVAASIQLPGNFKPNPIALDILKEFGFLRIGESGPGKERARSQISFNPMVADGEDDRFSEYSALIRSDLYPLGEVDGGLYFLAVDDIGRVFLVMDNLLFVNNSFGTALDILLMGVKVHPVDEEGRW